jgi:hypothetical protein
MACGHHGLLFGGSCLGCIARQATPHTAEAEAARVQRNEATLHTMQSRIDSLRGKYRGHGNYASSHPQHHMTAEQRRRLGKHDFALPNRNPPALPLRNPDIPGSARGYITAASGRLEMMKSLGHLKTGEYAQAKRHILAAARRQGMHSHFERS